MAPGLAFAIAVRRSEAYWTNYSADIAECPVNGCATPDVLASISKLATGVAVDATNVYWSDQLGSVTTCAIDRCATTTVSLISEAPENEFNEIALDDANVYILGGQGFGSGEVLRCAKSGCPNGPIVLASNLNGPVGFAVDGANVYWTEWGNSSGSAGVGRVAKCAVNGCNNVPTVIADNLDGPMGIAVDSTRVYWATQGAGPTDGQIHITAK